jgi:hypothetical protein
MCSLSLLYLAVSILAPDYMNIEVSTHSKDELYKKNFDDILKQVKI